MAEETKEYLDYDGLEEYHSKASSLFKDLTIQEVENAFNELDESDPSYSAFYDIITKAKEATKDANDNATVAEAATEKANTAATNADEATERANKAAEKLETVNDMTTGINLIRGSRDFRVGTKKVESTELYTDGFVKPSSATFTVDENGFTVANIKTSDATTDYHKVIMSNVLDAYEKDTVLTASFEFMVDDVNALDNDGIFVYYPTMATHIATISDFGIDRSSMESGKWYKVKFTYTLLEDITNPAYRHVRLTLIRNGSINFRKPTVQIGHINNPIYSVAPADLSLEPVNDITTGINLMRGTRDITVGTKRYGTADDLCSDGFSGTTNLAPRTIEKGEDGFGYIHYGGTATGASYAFASVLTPDQVNGDGLTISFELMIESNPTSSTNLLQLMIMNLDSNPATELKTYNYTSVGFDATKAELNKWHKIVVHYDEPINLSPTQYIRIGLMTANTGMTARVSNWRKLCAYRGHINNPEWSASPFDIDHINDETTGNNILRGTRDFIYGESDRVGVTYSDGFFADQKDLWVVGKDNDGYGTVSVDRSSASTANFYFRASHFQNIGKSTFTLSGMIKIDRLSASGMTASRLQFCRMVGLRQDGTEVGNLSAMFSELGIDLSKIGEWQPFIHVFDLSSISTSPYFFVDFQFARESTSAYSFKKLALYEGIVNHPIWSASPFDIAQANNIDTVKQHDITSLVKPGDNWELSRALMFVTSKRVAQLFVEVKAKEAVEINQGSIVCTLDQSIAPAASSVCSLDDFGAGWINGGTFNCTVTVIRKIPAGNTHRLLSTYILKNKYSG